MNLVSSDSIKSELSLIRYANDCSICVRSAQVLARLMKSITSYIKEDFLLKVNLEKSVNISLVKRTMLDFHFT